MRRVEQNSERTETALMAIAHDLKMPLATIRSVALDSEMSSEAEYRMIAQSADDALGMVNDMLEVYRLTQSQTQLQLAPVAANNELQRVVGDVAAASKLNARRLKPSYLPKRQWALFAADQHLLRRSLSNLIGNSLKYSDPRTKVMTKVFAGNQTISYQVADNGPMITDADLNALNGELLASSSKRSAGNSGLGLYLTGSMTRLMQGSVTANSSKAGNFITLTFPRVQQQRLF